MLYEAAVDDFKIGIPIEVSNYCEESQGLVPVQIWTE
jgi:hypothetical protein